MREYDYHPKPLIEEHYHIKDLFESQEKRVQDRTYHRERIKENEDREEQIKKAEWVILTDWWCDKCKKDFKSVGIKFIETDWSCPSQRVAFYRTKCFANHFCVRWITDKWKDPYWFRSKWVANERAKYANDILQEFQTGYNLVNTKK